MLLFIIIINPISSHLLPKKLAHYHHDHGHHLHHYHDHDHRLPQYHHQKQQNHLPQERSPNQLGHECQPVTLAMLRVVEKMMKMMKMLTTRVRMMIMIPTLGPPADSKAPPALYFRGSLVGRPSCSLIHVYCKHHHDDKIHHPSNIIMRKKKPALSMMTFSGRSAPLASAVIT